MFVIGRGKYARAVYPVSPAAGVVPTGPTFVVDSTVPPSGNVYPTLAAAAAARRKLFGPAIVEVPHDIAPPDAAYDLRDAGGEWNTTILGIPHGAPGATIIQWGNGTSVAGVSVWTLINSRYAGAAPFMSPPDGTRVTIDGTTLGGGGIQVRAIGATASGVDMFFLNAGSVANDGSTMDAQGAGSFLVVIAAAISGVGGFTIPPNCLAKGPGAVVLVLSGQPASNVSRTQAGIGGLVIGTNFFIQSLAENIDYTPANAVDWNGNSPKEVQEALDRIAAKIGPIP